MVVPAAGAVLDYARRLGVRRTCLRAAYVLANQVTALSIFDCVRLGPRDVNAALLESPNGFVCRFVQPDTIDGLDADLGPRANRLVRDALARGDLCFAVLDGRRLVNVSFYANRPTPLLHDLVMHFDRRYWYMHGAFTSDEYRGQRLHGVGILRAAIELFARDVPALVGVYERTNYPSMISAFRMGWRRCGTVYRVGIGAWSTLGRTAAARAMGMRLESRPMAATT